MKKAFLFFVIFVFVSCTSFEERFTQENTNFTGIPIEEALATLSDALTSLYPQTKAEDFYSAKEVITVTRADLFTDCSSSPTDTIAYVVNFVNNKGFALLAASRNIPDPVIAIVENGRMDKHLRIKDAFGTKGSSPNDTLSTFLDHLLNGYLITVHDGGGFDTGGGDDGNPPGGNSNGPWVTDSTITPMVHYVWSQSSPFNDYCPVGSDNAHLPAGCVPVATAMIVAYNQAPDSLSLNNRLISWNKVHNAYYYLNGDYYNTGWYYTDDVAYMIHEIGEICETWYHEADGWFLNEDFGFAFPDRAKEFLIDKGYNATKYNEYNVNYILPMLYAGKPVFIAAVSGLWTGHAWIIDGAMFQSRGSDTRTLLHCNWGWGGLSNGYFASGVFDLTQGPVANNFYYDPHNYTYLNYQFDHLYRIITY